MSAPVLLLHLLNIAFIGLLPVIFFTRGRLNARWWLTGAPFFVAAFLLVVATFGWITPRAVDAPTRTLLELGSVLLATGSIALIAFTLGGHRIPIALWHQADDAPRHIVTHGAYARIRHPFYAAFLLALLGAVLFCPHPATVAVLLYAIVVLNLTAAREERQLLASQFGREYAAYMRRTGRFWPGLGGRAS